MSRLTLPARKSFVKELQTACALNGTEVLGTPGLPQWRAASSAATGGSDSFSIVWVQGEVVEVSSDGDNFSISDSTGIVNVTKALSLPNGCPKPQTGQYLLVIGELQLNGPRPSVRAMKYQDLTCEREIAAKMWTWEVADARQCLSL